MAKGGWVQKAITLETGGRGAYLVHDEVCSALRKEVAEVGTGALHLLVVGSTSKSCLPSLSINENCDPTVRTDMTRGLEEMVRDCPTPDTSQAVLVGPSTTVPIQEGKLSTGTWQGLYLIDHSADGGHHSHRLLATVAPGCSAGKVTVSVPGRGVLPIDKELSREGPGVAFHLLQHTSAALTATSAATARTMEALQNRLIPEAWNKKFFKHTYEGPDDMPAHMKSTVMGAALHLPCRGVAGKVPHLLEPRNVGGWGCQGTRTVRSVVVPCETLHATVEAQCGPLSSTPALDLVAGAAKGIENCKVGLLCLSTTHPECALSIPHSSAASPVSVIRAVVPDEWGKEFGDQKDRVLACFRAAVLGGGVVLPVADGKIILPEEHTLVLTNCGGHSGRVSVDMTLLGTA